MYWNDDHFLLRHFHVEDFKYWHNGELEKEYKRARGEYKICVENTMRATPGFNYDIHVPIVLNKTQLPECMRLFNWKDNQYTIKTIYSQGRKESEYMDDCKINFTYSKRAIYNKLQGLFFSTGEYGLCPEMIEVFNELYPNPSNYEVTSHPRRNGPKNNRAIM